MFNFEEGKVDFESIEEVKEFLLGTEDLSVLGALCFANPDGTIEQEIPIIDLIEQAGIDKVAEILFNITKDTQPEIMTISKEEIIELCEKSEKGEELTEEETRKLNIINASMSKNKNHIQQRRNTLYNGLTMSLVQSADMPLFSTIGGNLALATTYLECAIVTSDEKLKRAFNNSATADDIINTATSKIHIDEDVSPELVILGLLHKIGDIATHVKEIREKPMDFESIVDMLDLDEDWIFNPGDKVLSVANRLVNGSNKNDSKENLDEKENGSNKSSDEKENGSNKDELNNIVDIRDRLRRK